MRQIPSERGDFKVVLSISIFEKYAYKPSFVGFLSDEDNVFIAEDMLRYNSVIQTQRAFRLKLNSLRKFDPKTICRILEKWKQNGSDKKKYYKGNCRRK